MYLSIDYVDQLLWIISSVVELGPKTLPTGWWVRLLYIIIASSSYYFSIKCCLYFCCCFFWIFCLTTQMIEVEDEIYKVKIVINQCRCFIWSAIISLLNKQTNYIIRTSKLKFSCWKRFIIEFSFKKNGSMLRTRKDYVLETSKSRELYNTIYITIIQLPQ